MAWVVDASVAAKWLFREVHSEQAAGLLEGDDDLLAVDLLYSEVGNVTWKKLARGDIEPDQAQQALTGLRALSLLTFPVGELLQESLGLAVEFKRSFYDATYLALAIRESAPLITADLRFYNALRDTRLAPNVRWIESVAA